MGTSTAAVSEWEREGSARSGVNIGIAPTWSGTSDWDRGPGGSRDRPCTHGAGAMGECAFLAITPARNAPATAWAPRAR
jgi:hypothetical protein